MDHTSQDGGKWGRKTTEPQRSKHGALLTCHQLYMNAYKALPSNADMELICVTTDEA